MNSLLKCNTFNYQYGENDKSKWKHIYVDEGINIVKNKLSQFDENLTYLTEYSTGKGKPVNIYILYQKINRFISGNWNQYVKEVFKKSNIDKASSVLITIPYMEVEEAVIADISFIYKYGMPGIYKVQAVNIDESKLKLRRALRIRTDLVTVVVSKESVPNSYTTIPLETAFRFVEEIYINTAKPTKIHYGFLFPNRRVQYKFVQSTEFVSGRGLCKEIILYKNKGINEINTLQKPSRRVISTIEEHNYTEADRQEFEADYQRKLVIYNKKVNKICASASLNNAVQWYEENSTIDFKQFKVDQYAKDYILKYTFKSSLKRYVQD